jgi:hypothetical protein
MPRAQEISQKSAPDYSITIANYFALVPNAFLADKLNRKSFEANKAMRNCYARQTRMQHTVGVCPLKAIKPARQ